MSLIEPWARAITPSYNTWPSAFSNTRRAICVARYSDKNEHQQDGKPGLGLETKFCRNKTMSMWEALYST